MKSKIYLFLFALLFANFVSYADSIDSLKQEFYTASNSEERYHFAYEIAKKTIFKMPDTAQKYLFDAVRDSAQNRQSGNLANCLNVIGIHYFLKSQYDSTIHYSTRALNIFLLNRDTVSSISARKNLALSRRNQGNYQLAISEFFIVLDLYKRQADTLKIVATLNDIGNTYSYLKNYQKAINYQSEALLYLRDHHNYKLEGNIYNSLGYVFGAIGQNDSAVAYYEKSLVLKQKGGDVYSIANSRNNLCTVIDYKTEPERCEECLLELLKDQHKINDKQGIARTFLNLSVQYKYFDECEKAFMCMDSTRKYLSFSEDIFLKQKYFDLYASTLYSCGKYQQAYEFYDSLLAIRDSIFVLEKQKELLELDTKYQTQQKNESIKMLETENTLASLQIKNQRLQISFLFFILASLLAGSVTFFFIIKQKQKKQRELALIKMREAERVRIAHDMHDEIGSGLTRISLLSEQLRHEAISYDKGKNSSISKIINQSRSLSGNLKEIIWAIDPANDLLSELLFYLRDYIYEFSSNSYLECQIDFPDLEIDFEVSSDVRRNIFLIVKEALNNTAKYADAKNVSVKFEIKNQLGYLNIKDDGKGFDQDLVKKGVGFISIQSRTEKLGGLFQIESTIGKGTQINISELQLITTNV